ncbi:DNA-binding transcriptional regulator AraC [compost metagenome]
MSEVAERTGYETQHYFSTAFKKQTGVSPLQFRKGVLPGEEGRGARNEERD